MLHRRSVALGNRSEDLSPPNGALRFPPGATVQASQSVRRGQALADYMERFVLADELLLPLDAVTRKFAILAPRMGGGKTHAARVLVEEMVADQLPIVVLDPAGDWHGLGWATDRDAQGLPVRILGGPHGGLDVREDSGRLVADLAVDLKRPLVVDLSSLAPKGARRFVSDFVEELSLRGPRTMHLVVDRADELLEGEALSGAGSVADLICSPDAGGLGLTLVTDSLARISPQVLARIETLIAARTPGLADRAAVRSWLSSRTEAGAARRVLETLASLELDEVWVCSPGWLGILQRVTLRHRATWGGSGARLDQLRPPQSRAAAAELHRLRARLHGGPATEALGPGRAEQHSTQPQTSDRYPREKRRGRPVERLVLGPDERAALQQYAKQFGRAPQLAMRARIVLECAEGRLNGDVARDLGVSIQMVGRWRRRFVQERLRGLEARGD
jgi:hypothetical protein